MNKTTDDDLLRENENFVNFTFVRFDRHQQILDYVADPNYMQKRNKPGLCFGFSINEARNGDIDVKMAFSGTEEDSDR